MSRSFFRKRFEETEKAVGIGGAGFRVTVPACGNDGPGTGLLLFFSTDPEIKFAGFRPASFVRGKIRLDDGSCDLFVPCCIVLVAGG